MDKDTIGLLVHSYNNYLAGMMGFTELSLMEVENEEVKDRLELSLASGKEAVVFGKQLLSMISRLQAQFKPVDLVPILKEIANGNGFSFETELSKAEVASDVQWFWYCLESLCRFCRAFSPECQLCFRLTQEEKHFYLQLESAGVSFNEEQKTKLFEPFYSSRMLLGSKDVGLAFIKGFVEQMKGRLEWREEQGFEFYLPLFEEKGSV
ncbi:HAMP domain-containing sensor histidine kinase [Aliikangiella sp. G2MR2-5]|uniref:sensor histidine kinase n=1 Tax=Aliikangiella sp. G2MR2-5 TaxID=2788943 RepID=UPI0018AC3024|nr:HAMP domain-containing sensor histidine kinase [Aliikangiella sp. G2MR2-5]